MALPPPAKGSRGHDALSANALLKVSRIDKTWKRAKRKKLKNANAEGGVLEVPGKLITRENDQYVTTIGMMLGLRVSLFYNAASVCEEIDPHRDSRASDHYVFPPEGCKRKDMPKTPKHHLSHTFKFKDYAPKVFHRIRLLNGISTKTCKKFYLDASQKASTKINLGHLKPPIECIHGEQDMDSVSGDFNYLRFTSNSKSGQFFFFTRDGDFMIKTISHEEVSSKIHVCCFLVLYFRHGI